MEPSAHPIELRTLLLAGVDPAKRHYKDGRRRDNAKREDAQQNGIQRFHGRTTELVAKE